VRRPRRLGPGGASRRGSVRDRVVELRRIRAGDLLEHPTNWRRHPEHQRRALQGLLKDIGYADALLAREEGGRLILVDGHLRRSLDPEPGGPRAGARRHRRGGGHAARHARPVGGPRPARRGTPGRAPGAGPDLEHRGAGPVGRRGPCRPPPGTGRAGPPRRRAAPSPGAPYQTRRSVAAGRSSGSCAETPRTRPTSGGNGRSSP